MGKRGPEPQGGKTPLFTMRLNPDLRSRLENEAHKSYRSLGGEIAKRLELSLSEPVELAARFGTAANYRIAQIVALAAQAASNRKGGRDWLQDAATFDLALNTIVQQLLALRPSGAKPDPFDMDEEDIENSRSIADDILKKIFEANDRNRIDRYGAIQNELGDIAKRPIVYRREYMDRVRELTSNIYDEMGPRPKNADETVDWLTKYSELRERMCREVEAQMIAEGKNPRLEEEHPWYG